MPTTCNLSDGATLAPVLPALTLNLTGNTTLTGRPELPWPHAGGYLGGAPDWPRLELWSPPASHAVWPFLRVPAGLRLTLQGLTLTAYPPYANRTAFARLLGPDVTRAALLPAVLALVRPASDVLLGGEVASWEAPPPGPGGELALVNVTAVLPDCGVWEELRQELCRGPPSDKVQVFSDLIHLKSFSRYGLTATDVFVTCLNASSTSWAGRQLDWPPPPPSPPPPMYESWLPARGGCAATVRSASDLRTVLDKANQDELPMYDEAQDDPIFAIRIRGTVRLSEEDMLAPANGTLHLRRAYQLWGPDAAGAILMDDNSSSSSSSTGGGGDSGRQGHLDCGGLPRPFALQQLNPPPNRVLGLRRVELLLSGLTISGLAPGDPSTMPHGLLTALGWAFGINTPTIERAQSQTAGPTLNLQDCVVVVSADELAYWRAAAGLAPRLQPAAEASGGSGGGAGAGAGDDAVVVQSGVSARQWAGWLNSSVNLEVDADSLNSSSSSSSLALRFLYYPALAFPTIAFRNVTLVTAADPRVRVRAAPPPASATPPTTTTTTSQSVDGVSSSSSSSSTEQGATSWEPLWRGADDGWLLRLAAPPEAVLAEAAGAAAADAAGAARAATAARWSTLPLSRVPTMGGNIPAVAWTTAFAAFVKDPSYLQDSPLDLPPPPPSPPQPASQSGASVAAGAGAAVTGGGRSQPVCIYNYASIRPLDDKAGGDSGGRSLPPAEPPLPPEVPRGAGGINPGVVGGGGLNTGAGVRRRRLQQRWRQLSLERQQTTGQQWRRRLRRALLGGGVGSGGGGSTGDGVGGFPLPVPGNVTLFGHPWFPTVLDLSDAVAALKLSNGSAVALRQLVLVGVAGGRSTQLSGAVPDSVATGGGGGGGGGGKGGGATLPSEDPPAEPPAPPGAPVSTVTGGGKTPTAGARRRRLQQAGTYRCAAGSYLSAAMDTCMACSPGTFQPDSNATAPACTPCPRGTFAPMAGAAACAPCPPGLSSTEPGASDCGVLWLPAAALLAVDFDRSYGSSPRMFLRDVLLVLPELEVEVLLALAPKLSAVLIGNRNSSAGAGAGGGNVTGSVVVAAAPSALAINAAVAAVVDEVAGSYAGLLAAAVGSSSSSSGEAAVRALAELLLSSEFELQQSGGSSNSSSSGPAANGTGGDSLGAELVLRRVSYAGVRGVDVRLASRSALGLGELQAELAAPGLPAMPPDAPEVPLPPSAPPSPPVTPSAPLRPPGPPRRLPPGVFQESGGQPPRRLDAPPPPVPSAGSVAWPPAPSRPPDTGGGNGAANLSDPGSALASEAVGGGGGGAAGAAAAAAAPGSSSGTYLQPWQAGVMVAGIVVGVAVAASLGGIILWNRCGPPPPAKASAPPPPPPSSKPPEAAGVARAAAGGGGQAAVAVAGTPFAAAAAAVAATGGGRAGSAVAGSSIELVDMSGGGQQGARGARA